MPGDFQVIRGSMVSENRQSSVSTETPAFSRNVTTNVAKLFLNILDIHFHKSNKLHKIFNGNTVKVSYCCTENLSSLIETHNKNVTNENITPKDQCSCKNKNDFSLDGNYQTNNIIYKCIASTTVNPDIIYLGTGEGNFTKRYYSQKVSFKKREKANYTTLSKYLWEVKDKHKETPSLKWPMVKSVPGYSNTTKKCLLCLHEKFEIISCPNQEELLNKRSALISRCRHVNKHLLSNDTSDD